MTSTCLYPQTQLSLFFFITTFSFHSVSFYFYILKGNSFNVSLLYHKYKTKSHQFFRLLQSYWVQVITPAQMLYCVEQQNKCQESTFKFPFKQHICALYKILKSSKYVTLGYLETLKQTREDSKVVLSLNLQLQADIINT